MKMDDNEHVRVHEIRGFASDNLHDAFKEAEAVSLGTKCQPYLFSVSVKPRASGRRRWPIRFIAVCLIPRR